MKRNKIRIAQFGCGPIGCSIVRAALKKQDIDIVGAIDFVNNDQEIGEIAGANRDLGVLISDDGATVINQTKPHVVLHATSSSLETIYPQIEMILKAGVNIVSTCEELLFPFREHPELASKIDSIARENKVTILGTGVNPGFLMDTWPLVMTAVCDDVTHVRVVRVQDASLRRIPFQKKIGAGNTIEEFDELVKQGTLRHVGLPESLEMLAAGLGFELDEIKETIEPIVAENEVSSDHITVNPGEVAGVKQVGYGRKSKKELIRLEFEAYIGAKEPYDAVYITGNPNVETIIEGGTHGDIATAAVVVNSIKRVIESPPGLVTMKDLPPVSWWTFNN